MSDTKVSSGFPLLSIMFLIFLTLKLTGHIAWSWWWVTAPLWGGFILAFVFIAVYLFFIPKDKPFKNPYIY